MNTEYDAIIVGGGPAGSSCAARLSAAGMRILVVDKKRFPRDKVCAGWVTPQVFQTLGIDPHDYRQERTLQEIRSFRVGIIGGQARTHRYGRTMSYGIRRCEFDDYLLRRSGAEVRTLQVRRIERRQRRWCVNDAFCAPLIIGAGGHFCPVARFLGAEPGKGEQAVKAQEIEFRAPIEWLKGGALDPEAPEIYFCKDFQGYGWIFHKDGYVNIGLGRIGESPLSPHVQSFCQWLISKGRIAALPAWNFKGHAYLLASHAKRKVVSDGVLLIGDAAGLAYSTSGEGIRPAVESGLLASRAILESGGDYRELRLRDYQEAIDRRFERNRPSLVDPPAWLLRRLFSIPWFVRRMVIERGFLRNRQGVLAQ